MELTKKTTILFPEDLHAYLTELAKQQGVSLGKLVRDACESQYGFVSSEERLIAVNQLFELSLPVSDMAKMKKELLIEPK